MIVPDVGLLVYTVNRDSPQCIRACEWWRTLLNGDAPVGLTWLTVTGVVHMNANPQIFRAPLALPDVIANVDEWFAQPVGCTLEPGARH